MESVVKVLALLGYVIVCADSIKTYLLIIKWGLQMDYLVETVVNVQFALFAMGAWEEARRSEKYAKTVYKILDGKGISFDTKYR